MPATPDGPVYYRTVLDIDILNDLDRLNREEAVYCITARTVDPLSAEAEHSEDSWEIRAARASAEELAEWGKAYDTLKQRAENATQAIATARARWEAERDAALAELRAAYSEYEHVHDTIARRHDEVSQLREKAAAEAQAAEEAKREAAQAAEDAELGPRAWVINEVSPDRWNSLDYKKTKDVFIPVIHVAGCPVTKGREEAGRPDWRYARAAAVEAALRTGGPLARTGRVTEERAPVKLCGRCKPEASLRAAGIGDAVDAWQTEVDAIQPPMPADRHIAKALGLQDDWESRYRGKDGYTLVTYDTYRSEGAITADEVLIGWFDATLGRVMSDEEAVAKQNRLFEILPDRGFAVRRFNEPKRFRKDEPECRAAVAVRRMRAGEIRQRAEDADATARYQEGAS